MKSASPIVDRFSDPHFPDIKLEKGSFGWPNIARSVLKMADVPKTHGKAEDYFSSFLLKTKAADENKNRTSGIQWRRLLVDGSPKEAENAIKGSILNDLQDVVAKSVERGRFSDKLRMVQSITQRRTRLKRSKSVIEFNKFKNRSGTNIEEYFGVKFAKPRSDAYILKNFTNNQLLALVHKHIVDDLGLQKNDYRFMRRRSCEGDIVSGGQCKKLKLEYHTQDHRSLLIRHFADVHDSFRFEMPWFLSRNPERLKRNLDDLRKVFEENAAEDNQVTYKFYKRIELIKNTGFTEDLDSPTLNAMDKKVRQLKRHSRVSMLGSRGLFTEVTEKFLVMDKVAEIINLSSKFTEPTEHKQGEQPANYMTKPASGSLCTIDFDKGRTDNDKLEVPIAPNKRIHRGSSYSQQELSSKTLTDKSEASKDMPGSQTNLQLSKTSEVNRLYLYLSRMIKVARRLKISKFRKLTRKSTIVPNLEVCVNGVQEGLLETTNSMIDQTESSKITKPASPTKKSIADLKLSTRKTRNILMQNLDRQAFKKKQHIENLSLSRERLLAGNRTGNHSRQLSLRTLNPGPAKIITTSSLDRVKIEDCMASKIDHGSSKGTIGVKMPSTMSRKASKQSISIRFSSKRRSEQSTSRSSQIADNSLPYLQRQVFKASFR